MKAVPYTIVGFGGVGKNHALAACQAALYFPGEWIPQLAGVMNRTPHAAPLPGVPHFTDLAKMTGECKPAFLDLCMPHHLRKDAFLFAAEHRLPVYCEKPLADTLRTAEELAEIAKDLPVGLAFVYRYLPAVSLMKENLSLIGNPIDFKAVFFHDSYLLPRPKTWRMTCENGGGALLDLGVHFLDLLAYLLGPLTYESGDKGIYFKDRNEVEEFGRMVLKAPICSGTLEVSRIHATEEGGKTVTLYGERGSLFIDLEKPYELRHYDLASRTTQILRASDAFLSALLYPAPRNSLGFYQDAHTCSLMHFARLVATGEPDPLLPTLQDGLAAQKLLAQILE
ncbi:MAG: Gfo/Idh/MocA family oxidoreductase [Clostridia bacterium]|nr:Gfo/Idh/MocA family oxidoreductase [Clostridia bacterium]